LLQVAFDSVTKCY